MVAVAFASPLQKKILSSSIVKLSVAELNIKFWCGTSSCPHLKTLRPFGRAHRPVVQVQPVEYDRQKLITPSKRFIALPPERIVAARERLVIAIQAQTPAIFIAQPAYTYLVNKRVRGLRMKIAQPSDRLLHAKVVH